MSFAEGVQLGMSLRERRRREAMQAELADIGAAAPAADNGFTPEQGMTLDAAARSGQYDVAYDPEKGGYTVTSKSDPGSSGVVTPQARTTYLGRTYDRALNDDEITNARQLAMAGALEKHGDIEGGASVRRNVLQNKLTGMQIENTKAEAERSGARFGWEKTDRARLERDRAKEDEWVEGGRKLFEASPIGQQMKAYSEAQNQYQADMAEYKKRIESGDSTAIEPSAPKPPMPGVGDSMQLMARSIAHNVQFGKADPQQFMQFAQAVKKVNEEGLVQAARMAQGGAPLTEVVRIFNAQGEAKIDRVLDDKMVDRDHGMKSRVIRFMDQNGQERTLDTLSELDKIKEATDLFKRAMDAHTMDRQDKELKLREREVSMRSGELALGIKREAREQTRFDEEAPIRSAKSEEAKLRSELATTEDPERQKQIESRLRALATGTRAGAAGHDPAKVAEARALVAASGGKIDEATALDNVISKPQGTYEKYLEAATKSTGSPQEAAKAARKMMSDDGWEQTGAGLWRRKAAAASFDSADAVEKAAKAGRVKRGDVVVVNGKRAIWE